MFLVRIDIYGFWIGVIAAETVTNTLLFVLIERFDWKSHSNKALKRILLNPTQIKTEQIIASDEAEQSKPDEIIFESNPTSFSWWKEVRVKLVILVFLVFLFVFGIFTSTTISLYPE